MKKIITLFLIIACTLSLIACDKQSGKDFDKAETYSFQAKVLDVSENSLMVEPLPDTNEIRSADKITVSLKNKTTSWPSPSVGDIISIVYDGSIMESYPAQLGNVYQIKIIEHN